MDTIKANLEAIIKGRDEKRVDNWSSEKLYENNMHVKSQMVTELVEMGLSLESIGTILNLDSDSVDRLL